MVPAPGKESRFNGRLRVHLEKVYEEFANPDLTKRFSWHSL